MKRKKLPSIFVWISATALLGGCAQTARPRGVPAATSGAIQELIPQGQFARRNYRPLHPTYITIHSTDNPGRGADARAHALIQKRGAIKGRHNAIGYVSWHFSVDDHSVYQSLPTNERGEHADYDGPGNRSSIGIEMCVNRGNDRKATIERTAQLTASLMNRYSIPLSHVVPHMHWRQVRHDDGKDLGFKKCPALLLDGGQLGPKWNAFLKSVEAQR